MRAFIVQSISNGYLITETELDSLLEPDDVRCVSTNKDVKYELSDWLDRVVTEESE